MAERVVVLPLAPPKRLMQPLVWRSFKTGPDRLVWRQAWARVEALQSEGWRVQRVHVDWGNRRPAFAETCERELTRLMGAVTISQELSGRPGRGETRVTLVRDA